MNITQSDSMEIELEQRTYINSIDAIATSNPKQMKDEDANETQKTELRRLVGKLNWIQVSRPDIGFETRYLSTILHIAKIKDLHRANKTLKYLKSEHNVIKFPALSNTNNLFLLTFSDASFGNLPSGHSQAAYVILLCDEQYNCSLLSWNSFKLQRVCTSTLGAETLGLNEALEQSILLSTIYSEVINPNPNATIPITALTDSKSLVNASATTNFVKSKSLRITIAALRESLEKNEFTLKWIDSKYQISNCLTKAGASSQILRQVIMTGKCNQEIIAALRS